MHRMRAVVTVIALVAVGCTDDGSTGSTSPRSGSEGAEVTSPTGPGPSPTGANTAPVSSVTASTTAAASTTTAPASVTTTEPTWTPDADLLPTAAADVAPSPDENAAGLAAVVQQGGDAGLAALLRGLEIAGVGISSGDQIVRAAGAPSQGLLVAAGDVLAMGALFPDPNLVSLDLLMHNVGAVAGLAMTDETAAGAADALLTDLRDAAGGTAPSQRFFARFIAALTSPASTPDLLGATSGRGVVLTGPQAMLLVARLAADVLVADAGRTGVSGLSGGFVGAASRPTRRAGNQPCSFDNAILDTGTTGLNMGLSTLLDYLEGKGLDTAKIGGAMNLAGLLSGLIKLLATAALFDAHLELLDAPLVRVMGPGNPGQQRQIEATLEFQPTPAVWVNCLAPMLQILNGDAGVPLPGPIKNGRVMWSGTTGFASGTATGYVEFYTLAGTAPPGPQGGLVSMTDDAGKARIGIEGTAPEDLVPTWAPELRRPFTMNIALDTRETDAYRTILSAFSQLTNPAAQSIVESAVRGLIGMGVISRSATFEIVDHAPDIEVAIPVGQFMLDGGLCSGDGTLTLSGTDTSTGMSVTANGTFVFDTDETGAGTLTFTSTMDLSGGVVPIDATASFSGSGDVQISSGEGQTVTIDVTNVSSTASGSGTGPGASMSVGLPTDANGNSSLSGTAGLYCE